MSGEKADLPSEGAQRVKEPGQVTERGKRGIFGSLTHGQHNTDEKTREGYGAAELRTSTEL